MNDEIVPGRNAAAILVDAHIAATNGDRRALTYRDKVYSFHDLAALMNRGGNMLRSLGAEPGSHVLILLSPSPVLFGLMLGAIKIGAVALVQDTTLDAAAVSQACARYAPAVAILDGTRFQELSGALGNTQIVVAGEQQDGHASLIELLRSAPSSLAAQAVEDGSPALTVLSGERAVTATHVELARLVKGKAAIALRLSNLDLSASFALLAGCRETAIPTPP